MKKFQTQINGKEITVQIGGLAEQASGSCLITSGETTLLCTAQLGEERQGISFFPLTCDYEERYYAAGKIGGSRYYRREGKPSTEAVLLARMIDRAVRPLFPEGFRREVQIIATSLSWDEENDPGILGILGSSISLVVSEIPWEGPVGVVRVALLDEKFIVNPNYEEREAGEMDFVFCGVEKQGQILVNMIEGEAKEVPEEKVKQAYKFALPFIKHLIDFQREILKQVNQSKIEFEKSSLLSVPSQIKNIVDGIGELKLEKALFVKDKRQRETLVKEIEQEIKEKIIKEEFGEENIAPALDYFHKKIEKIVKEKILKEEKRVDLRRLDEVREIETKAGLFPRIHGSGFFSRGLTKVLSLLTLGAPGDQQLIDTMEIEGKKRFFHHYNFPPYCAGEVGFLGAPKRREIGHGMLGERALLPVLPSFDEFPYTIRIVSEVLSSNGSTSMASVSAASLALMDAGVPIKAPVAGIAMGLVKESNENFKILTDIQGPEDHYGDMDFKVGGTEKGITVVQMDVKIDGITQEIFNQALEGARKARMQILSKMKQTLSAPRKTLSPYAPRVQMVEVDPDKIGLIIGSGGRVINDIIQEYNVEIDIEETGKVFITGQRIENVRRAAEKIKSIVREIEVGDVFQGKVTRLLNFGAMVEIAPGREGLVHISELSNKKVNKVSDVVSKGDVIAVKVIGIDEFGRINLSARQVGFRVGPQKRFKPSSFKPRQNQR